MADSPGVFCSTCKKTFSSRRYYSAHFKYKANSKCKEAFDKKQPPTPKHPATATAAAVLPVTPATNKRPCTGPACNVAKTTANVMEAVIMEDAAARAQIFEGTAQESCVNNQESCVNNSNNTQNSSVMEAENLDNAEESDDNNNLPAADSDFEEEDEGVENTPKIPTREMLEEFMRYSDQQAQNTCDLPADLQAGIKLLALLSERRVPLNMYDIIFKWHTEHLGAKTHIPIKTLVSRLSTRYNLDDAQPFVKKLELPHSKARIKLVCHDAKAQIMSLLTDPRFEDDDYLFFNPDNPLEGPPEEWTHVSDINTGRAYRETWKEVIKDPEKEILLPVMFYMDAAVAGNYDSLPIEAVKMGLGLYNGKTRDLEFAWRPIGFITHFLKEDTQGIDILHETEHMDAEDFMSDSSSDDEQSDSSSRVSHLPNFGEDDNEQSASSEEEEASSVGIPACSAQDLHTMLDAILESYRELQNCGGFEWDFRYRGKTYPVIFKPFCIFIKGDSQEHDKHCGSYTSRGKFIQQLCR